jgi:uncharacterized protein (TIGR02246 family)
VLIATAFAAACAPPQRPPVPSATTEDAILRQAPAEWDRLFNAGALTALADLYADDAVSMPFNARTVQGRDAVLAEFEKLFADNQDLRHETVVDELLATSDWAIERARYTMSYTTRRDKKAVMETGRHVMCRKRVDGRWQIVWEIFNTDMPPAP